ncbi:MAG: hypothetical protein VX498_08240, partial [Myxococcota bacterium]|nr:hypothetical protein [Myxococcota bacterium]
MALLVLLSACVLGTNAWWLAHNDLPDGFQNEYEHVFTLTEVFFRWRDNSLGDAWPHLWDGYYPPLNVVVGSAAMAVGGSSLDLALGSLTLFFLLLLVVVLLMGLRFEGPWTAALAVGLVALYPGIYGNLRRFEPNLVLAAMVALAIAWLVQRGRLRSYWGAAAFGLFLGVGMLADRLVFAVYLVPVLGVCLSRAWKWKGSRATPLGLWATALVVAALVCGYYYLRFFELQHTAEVTTQLGGEVTAAGASSSNHPFWTLRGLSYYPMSWIDCQMGLVLGSLTISGLGL